MDSWWPYFKGFSSFIYGPESLEICIVAPDTNVSQIFDILFSLGIHRGNVILGPKICNFEVQMGVTFQ